MNQAAQERQLVLTESLTNQIQNVLANQQALSATTDELRRQNLELKKALENVRTESQTSGRIKRRRSSVEVPDALKGRFKKVYALLVSRNVIEEFHLNETALSTSNRAILNHMKEELRKEHGGENCPWTDLEIEAQFKTYFKTRKERAIRISQGVNESHKARSKSLRRLNAKLDRRLTGLGIMMPELDKKCAKKMNEILERDFMSSEESEYEDREENGVVTKRFKCYRIRRLPWERKQMKKLKKKMDNAYLNSLTKHAKGMIKERKDGQASLRSCPPGPHWAVRKDS